MPTVDTPFGTDEIPEIHLERSPLVKAIAQIQFPRLSSLASSQAAANRYAETMATPYPIFTSTPGLMFVVTQSGIQQQDAEGSSLVWQLEDPQGAWKIVFTDSSLAIETSVYISRQDFCQRLETALDKFIPLTGIPYITRLGVRYVNRLVADDEMQRLPEFFREAIGSFYSTKITGAIQLQQSLMQNIYSSDADGGLMARWGQLPANVMFDPSVPPVDTISFILDIDAFLDQQVPMPTASVVKSDALRLAARAHRYFRWATTDSFLRHSGGQL